MALPFENMVVLSLPEREILNLPENAKLDVGARKRKALEEEGPDETGKDLLNTTADKIQHWNI